jgi:hypothetical protein
MSYRGRTTGFDSRQGQGFYFLRHSLQTDRGAHRTSYQMDICGKIAGA